MRRRHECIKVAARRSGRPISTRPYQKPSSHWTVLSQWDQRLEGLDPSDPDSKSLLEQAVSVALSLVEECQWDIQSCAELFLSISNSEYRRLAIQEFARKGVGKLWTDQSETLAVILRYYKEQHQCDAVKELAEAVATENLSFDVWEKLINNPELSLFRDTLEVLPPKLHPSENFHFPTHLRSLIFYLRTSIRDSALPIFSYYIIKNYSPEKRWALEDLLNYEYPNEEPELVRNALNKSLYIVEELINRMEKIDQAFKENAQSAEVCAVAQSFFSAFWEQTPKTCRIPAELLSLIQQLDPRRSFNLDWLHRFLSIEGVSYSQAEQLVFPIRVSEFTETLDVPVSNQRGDTGLVFRNELLRVAFPEVLLHNTISAAGSMSIAMLWLDLHCHGFADYVRNMCMMGDRLFAVFTRDKGEVATGNCVVLKATSFSSAADFKQKLTDSLTSQEDRVYILDISPSEVNGMSVDAAKEVAEELYPDLADLAKSLCLLVRIPRTAAQVTGRWSRLWKLMSFEQLHTTFHDSILALRDWLKQDTKELLAAEEFWKNEETMRNIVKRIYSSLEVSEDMRERRVREITNDELLERALGERLRSLLSTSRVSDWKSAVLSTPALLSEPTLRSARLRALEIEAAALLTPILRTTEYYNAFPSFLRGSSNIKKLWLESFSLLQGMNRVREMLEYECRYPFSAKDYEEVVIRMTIGGQRQEIIEMYQSTSVTAAHCRKYPGFETDELLQLYIGDLARIDLQKSEKQEYGEYFYQALCATAGTFAEAFATFCEKRRDIIQLCSSGHNRVQEAAQAEAFFGLKELWKGPAAPRNNHLLLAQRLEDFKELLEVNGDLPYRLYTIRGNMLSIVRCRNLQLEQVKLEISLNVKYTSILILSSTGLFCCGGIETGIFADTSSGAWLVTVNTGSVSPLQMMRKPRFDHGLVLFDNWVYAIGSGGNK